ncbi:MAG: glycerol-3-phosphate acyltransferase [Gammaproteobacteria bacterium]|nr:glycerol-3-phosphate acyltransferase [Gammaproteobacteria bacterium]
MFSADVSVPLWLYLILLGLAAYAMVMSILFPGVRWFLRRRLNIAVDRINTSLQIKIRPLQQTRRQVLIDQLIFDQDVLAMLEKTSGEQDIPRQVLQQRVRTFAREIVPAFNAYIYYRVFYWLAKSISRFVYRVRVGASHPERLQQLDPESTVVFVMNHRSNMDYVLVSYLAAERAALSYAVGEWARIFPLETLIRAMGAFFVRRDSRDPLYRKVLERYIHLATGNGVCQAVFPEGKLSRDGRLGEPRLGFLDYILRHYDWQRARGVVFIPVAINYDHILEDSNLLDWDDRTKHPSAAEHFRRLWRFLRLNLFAGPRARFARYGYASVNFGEPLDMREFCSDRGLNLNHLEKEQRIQHVAQIAQLLMRRLHRVMPVLPAPLAALALLRRPDESLTSLEIAGACDDIIDELMAQGSPMKKSEKPRPRTVQNALHLMREHGLVLEEDDHFRINPDNVRLLEFYANSIRPPEPAAAA